MQNIIRMRLFSDVLMRLPFNALEKLTDPDAPDDKPEHDQGPRALAGVGALAGSAYYFFMVTIIRHETTAAACWALLLIVRTLFNDALTVAVWTSFHVCLLSSQA